MNPEYHDQWLEPENQDTDSLKDLMVTDISDMEYYPASIAVNKPVNNGPELIVKQ